MYSCSKFFFRCSGLSDGQIEKYKALHNKLSYKIRSTTCENERQCLKDALEKLKSDRETMLHEWENDKSLSWLTNVTKSKQLTSLDGTKGTEEELNKFQMMKKLGVENMDPESELVKTLLESYPSRPHPVQKWAESGERLYKYAKVTKVSEELDVTNTGTSSQASMAPEDPKEKTELKVSWVKLCKQMRTKCDKEMKKIQAASGELRSLKAHCQLKGATCLKQMAEKAELSLNNVMDGWTLQIQAKRDDEVQHDVLKRLRDEMEEHAKTCKGAIQELSGKVHNYEASTESLMDAE